MERLGIERCGAETLIDIEESSDHLRINVVNPLTRAAVHGCPRLWRRVGWKGRRLAHPSGLDRLKLTVDIADHFRQRKEDRREFVAPVLRWMPCHRPRNIRPFRRGTRNLISQT